MGDAIDLNRGVTIKSDPSTGARIFMYKDEPGVFLNAHGAVVAASLAARCGFPVKDLGNEEQCRDRGPVRRRTGGQDPDEGAR